MADITVTADSSEDPFSAWWSKVTDSELKLVVDHLEQSTTWTQESDLTLVRVADLLVYVEPVHRGPALYTTSDPGAVDVVVDLVERACGRGPDSLG